MASLSLVSLGLRFRYGIKVRLAYSLQTVVSSGVEKIGNSSDLSGFYFLKLQIVKWRERHEMIVTPVKLDFLGDAEELSLPEYYLQYLR